MEELFERIRQYVDGHHDEMLALWEEMVNTESGSRRLEGVAAMDDILRRELESVGAKVRVLPVENAGGVLVAEWNSGSPKAPLLFIGHVDTVFKEGTAEDNPFRIDEQGRAHRPGRQRRAEQEQRCKKCSDVFFHSINSPQIFIDKLSIPHFPLPEKTPFIHTDIAAPAVIAALPAPLPASGAAARTVP